MATHQHTYHYYDAICQYSNRGYREGKHEISKRTKNSCISYFRICIKTDAFEDKKPEYYKICSVSQRKTTNHVPTLVKSFVIQSPTSSRRKTHVNAQIKVLEYLRSARTSLNARNGPPLTSYLHSKQRLRRWAIVNNKEITS